MDDLEVHNVLSFLFVLLHFAWFVMLWVAGWRVFFVEWWGFSADNAFRRTAKSLFALVFGLVCPRFCVIVWWLSFSEVEKH